MRYLKYPQEKRRDRSIPFVQDSFTTLMKDIPASECPNNAVVDAVNALLFGDRWKARPGSTKWSDTVLPGSTALTNMYSYGNWRDSDYIFTSADIGSYIVYTNGVVEEITDNFGRYAVIQGGSHIIPDTTGVIQRPINGIGWHKKTQKIFVHIGTKIYFTDYSVTTWTQLYFSIGALTNSRSSFDSFNDYIYVFNDNGVFKIDTQESPYYVIQINTASPPNTINPCVSGGPLNIKDYDEDTVLNNVGRRYIYSLAVLNGTGEIRNRFDDKLIKETGNNPVTSANDYKDYKEIWFKNRPGDKIQENSVYKNLDLTNEDLAIWIGRTVSWQVTITDVDGNSTTGIITADFTNAISWEDVAFYLTAAMRKTFTEYPYLRCEYSVTSNALFFIPGETDVNIGLFSNPLGLSGTHHVPVSVNNAGYNAIGNIDTPNIPLRIPSGEYGWTHFSVYSTKSFTNANDDLTDKQAFIWNADIRVVAIIKGTIDSLGVLTVTEGQLENCDSGCTVYIEDGPVFLIKNVINSTSANTTFQGDGSTVMIMAIGASSIMEAIVSTNVLTIPAKLSGTRFGTHVASTLVDTGATFVTSGIVAGDWVRNMTDGTAAQVTRILRGKNDYTASSFYIIDYTKDFITAGVQAGDIVKSLTTGESTIVAAVIDKYTLSLVASGTWGSKYPLANPQIEFADDVWIGGSKIAVRLKATAMYFEQFPGVSIKPPWGSAPWYMWSFKSIPATQYPPPNSRFGFTDNASYDGNVYDFHHGETGNRVFLEILSDPTGTFAYVKLIAVESGTNYQGADFAIIKYDEYATYPISDFKTKSFKLELSGNQARMLYDDSPVVTPRTDGSGWVYYTTALGGDFRPTGPLSSQIFWAQLDDNYDALTSELIISDVTFNAGVQSYTPIEGAVINGNWYVVYEPNAETKLPLDSNIFDSGLDDYQIHRGRIVSTDVGKTVHWRDGTTGIITGHTDNWTVTVNTPVDKSQMPMIIDTIGRYFSDVITDDILSNRQESWRTLGRFMIGLPSGELGDVSPGFLNVAARLDQKSYYSSINLDNIYMAGHYRADYQFLEFKDRLIEIQEMPNQTIFWCTSSTFKTQTNVQNGAEDELSGEYIPIQSGPALTDGSIGAMDKNSIIDIGIGQKMVITSEPGIRMFDGYRYGENQVIDEKGRGLILKDLQLLRHRFIATYDPNLYGFIFWGNNTTIVFNSTAELVRSTKCFRLAIRPEQGFSFSELSGDDWLWPFLGGGPLLINDNAEEQFLIIFDHKSRKPYVLSTRKYSALSTRTVSFLDKETTEIAGSIKHIEHTSQEEDKKLRFMEQYFYMRPDDEANKGAGGHDSYGFRTAQEIRIDCFLNGNVTADAEVNQNSNTSVQIYGVNQTKNLLPNLAYPYNVEARRVQHKISFTASEIECVKYRVLYDEKNVIVPPQLVTGERNWQREFALPVFWISRGTDKLLNLVTGKSGNSSTGSYNTRTGPDGKANSSMDLDGQTFTWNNIVTAPDTTFLFHIENRSNLSFDYKEVATELYNNRIRIFTEISGSDKLLKVYIEDVEIAALAINTILGIDLYIVIDVRAASVTIKVYDQYETLFGTATGVVSISGSKTVTLQITGTSMALFDFRKYNQDANNLISDAAKLYWIRDINQYAGFSLLPEVGS